MEEKTTVTVAHQLGPPVEKEKRKATMSPGGRREREEKVEKACLLTPIN